MLDPKWIVGKTVKVVDVRPFQSNWYLSAGRPIAHRPIITFTDGSKIWFGKGLHGN